MFSGTEFTNVSNLNSPGANYAALFGKDKTKLIADEVKKAIFDATPQDMYEIPLLYMNSPRQATKAEFSWMEAQIQRVALITPILGSTIAADVLQTIPLNNPADIGIDTIVTEVITNEQATVIDVDTNANTFTIRAMSGSTLAAKSSGTSYKFIQQSSLDADARTNITQRFRLDKLVERYNYVQQFARATQFGREEMWTYQHAGTTNYPEMNRSQLRKQFMMDLVGQFINGKRGEMTLSDGTVAKTMNGVYPTMVAAGSPYLTTTLTNIVDGLFKAAFMCRYGKGLNRKYVLAKPELISQISRTVKQDKMWWEASNDFGAQFKLEMISDASNELVLVPCGSMGGIGRFLPDFYEKLVLILDYESIRPVIMWDMRVGEVGSREKNSATLSTVDVEYIEGTLSQEYENPLGGAYLNVS